MSQLIIRLILSAAGVAVLAFLFIRIWKGKLNLWAALRKPADSLPMDAGKDEKAPTFKLPSVITIAAKAVLVLLLLCAAAFFYHRVWTNEIDVVGWLRRPAEAIPVKAGRPDLVYFFDRGPNYAPGLKVAGVEWKADYVEFFLTVRNKSKELSATDVRLDIDMVAPIISHTIETQRGLEGLRVGQDFQQAGIGSKDTLTEMVKALSNQLEIDATKMSPAANFSVRIVVSRAYGNGDGVVGLRYRFGDGDATSHVDWRKLLLLNRTNLAFRVDTNQIEGKIVTRRMMFATDPPISFRKDGRVEVDRGTKGQTNGP